MHIACNSLHKLQSICMELHSIISIKFYKVHIYFNSSHPSAAYMRQWIGSAFEIIVCEVSAILSRRDELITLLWFKNIICDRSFLLHHHDNPILLIQLFQKMLVEKCGSRAEVKICGHVFFTSMHYRPTALYFYDAQNDHRCSYHAKKTW